jgi:hypothetical protein
MSLQVDRTRDQDRLYADQSFALEHHVENLVLVADFGKRQRNRRATVANALFAIDLLRLVQMAEGHIADTFVEQFRRQCLSVADDQAALGVFRHRATGHVCMADSNQRLAFFAFGVSRRDQPFMDLADTVQVVVTQVRTGNFRRAQERQRQAPARDLALGIRQRDQQALGVQLAIVQPQHAAQRMGTQTAHQRRGQFDP